MRRWLGVLLASCAACSVPSPAPLELEAVQPELFGAPGAQPLAWADFDNDGDLDLFVGLRYSPNRLYRNDDGTFRDVAPTLTAGSFRPATGSRSPARPQSETVEAAPNRR